MIAHRDQCDPNLLVELLHARLDLEDEVSVTRHLEFCDECRRNLEQLTAPEGWWSDTQRILSDSKSLAVPIELAPALPMNNAVAWVTNLLKPPKDGHSIGTLDGLPVREVIGQGGMGVVLKVWDEELHRPLAVKLLSPMLASHGASRQRFFREAQAAAAVVHPNIVPIYSVVSDSVLPYLVMPYVAGGNLQQRLDDQGPLPIAEVLSVGVQIAEALVAAHRLGLVHRDIKPANILLDEGGHRVLLSDFGLARTIDDASVTNSGMVAGTPQYMSPEQSRGASIDHRSDLYSLGAVLYAMATARPPVRGESTLEILRRVGEEQPVAIYDINETMPVWLDKLVGLFLEKQLDKRVASAEDAVELLRISLAHTRSPAHNPLPRNLIHETKSPRFMVLIAVCVVAVMLSLFAVAWTLTNQNTRSSNSVANTRSSQAKAKTVSENGKATAPIAEPTIDQDISNRLVTIESSLREMQNKLESETNGLVPNAPIKRLE